MILLTEILLMLTLQPTQVSQPTVGPQGTFQQTSGEGIEVAIKESLTKFGYAWIGNGTHQMRSALNLTSAFNGCAIYGAPGAVLIPPTDTTTAINITGSDITLQGFTMRANTYVDTQSVIKIDRARHVTLDNIRFKLSASGGSSTGMKLVNIDHALDVKILNCTFNPNRGVTCIYGISSYGAIASVTDATLYSGNGVKIHGCEFATDVQSAGADYQSGYADCYRGIYFDGIEYSSIVGNRFFQLGNGSTTPLDSVISILGRTDLLVEAGHILISSNFFERVSCPKSIQIYSGSGGVAFINNFCGLAGTVTGNALPDAAGEAFIVVSGRDGTATSTVQPYQVDIMNNSFHNLAAAGTNGAFIFGDYFQNLNIIGNTFDFCYSNNVIRTNSGGASGLGLKTQSMKILSNTFDATSTVATAINLDSTVTSVPTGWFAKGLVIGHNVISENFTAAITDNVVASASGARKILTGIQNVSTGNDNTSSLSTNVRLGL